MSSAAWPSADGFDPDLAEEEGLVAGGVARETLDDIALAAMAAAAEPGPTMMAMLSALDPSGLPVAARIDVAAAWQRQAAWVAAHSRVALAAVRDAPPEPEPAFAGRRGDAKSAALGEAEWRGDELAAVLRWPPITADRKLEEASRLVGVLPATLASLAAGEISDRHADALIEAVEPLSPERARAVEARVLPRAAGQTVAEFRRSARRAALRADPDLAAANRARAITQRGVRVAPRPDGMAALIATMAAEDAHTVWLALDAHARKAFAAAKPAAPTDAEPEPDGVDALRADTLLAWADHALAEPDLPRRHGRQVELQIVIDAPTLLGLADNPAELAGHGPIPATAARELAADATWRRLVVEPVTGHLLDYGQTVYRPPQALADFLVNRDRRCRFPGCSRAADAGDLDHVIPFDQGGPTAAHNMGGLCRRHHRLKTHGRWKLEMTNDSTLRWTSPHGHVFHVDPHPQLE